MGCGVSIMICKFCGKEQKGHPEYTHYEYHCCGAVKLDSDRSWGIGANMEFESMVIAKFYIANGRLPEPLKPKKVSIMCQQLVYEEIYQTYYNEIAFIDKNLAIREAHIYAVKNTWRVYNERCLQNTTQKA